MHPEIKRRFNDGVLSRIGERFGVSPADLKKLDAFENFVYEVGGVVPTILRVSHSLRRTTEQIAGEVEWVAYLRGHGIAVCEALPSLSGGLYEEIEDGEGECFLACLFRKAEGKRTPFIEMSDATLRSWGDVLGKIHAASASFPEIQALLRPKWSDPAIIEVREHLGEGNEILFTRFEELQETVTQLSRSVGCGLIHNDAHWGNFHVGEDGSVELFDFDDCCRGPFVKDVAMVLYYVMGWSAELPLDRARHFWQEFCAGYLPHRDMSGEFELIEPFLMIRDITIYASLNRSFSRFEDERDGKPYEKRMVELLDLCRARAIEQRPKVRMSELG